MPKLFCSYFVGLFETPQFTCNASHDATAQDRLCFCFQKLDKAESRWVKDRDHEVQSCAEKEELRRQLEEVQKKLATQLEEHNNEVSGLRIEHNKRLKHIQVIPFHCSFRARWSIPIFGENHTILSQF